MDTTPLVSEVVEAGRELIGRLKDHFPVLGACWLRDDCGGPSYLYVIVDGLTVPGRDAAYGEVYRITQEMKDVYLDPFRVKVVGPTDPVAKAVLEMYRLYPGRVPTYFTGTGVSNVAVEEVYIYPPLKRA